MKEKAIDLYQWKRAWERKHRGDRDGWDDRNAREVVYQGCQSGDPVSDDRRDNRASGSRQEVSNSTKSLL